MPIARAIEEAHYPDSFPSRDAALRRLAFDELLALQLGMVAASPAAGPRRGAAGRHRRRPLDASVRSALVEAIGGAGRRSRSSSRVDQDAAIDAIREDLARPTPMLRLLQGDVGSGKTAVAAYALAATARAGSRAPSSHRPTCSRASTSRRSGRCWRSSGSASRC